MGYLDTVKERCDTLHFIRAEHLVPCTEEEIVQLEQRMHVSFPQAYKEFLLWMGHKGGALFIGSACFFADLPSLRQAAENLLQEDQAPLSLPQDALVFFMHQGYSFDFLRTSEGEDPPVYFYLEDNGQTTFVQVFAHYSEALLAWIENDANITASLAQQQRSGYSFYTPEVADSIAYYLEGLQSQR